MNTDEKGVIAEAAREIGEDVAMVKKAIAAYKKDGKAGLVAMMPEIVAEIKDDIAPFKAAAPVVKAGYKTTEFWLVASLIIANAAFLAIKGTALPIDVNATSGVMIGIYTAARAAIKK